MYIERDVHMKLKKFIAPLLVGVLAFAIAGCGTNTNQSSQTPKEIKIGATAGPHAQVAEASCKRGSKARYRPQGCGILRLCNTRQSIG